MKGEIQKMQEHQKMRCDSQQDRLKKMEEKLRKFESHFICSVDQNMELQNVSNLISS